jgi:hypothetical protein
MRTVSLARVAAQAEAIRLRAFASRTVVRATLAGIAVFFLIAGLVAGHIAGGMALTPYVGPLRATLIVGGADLVIAVILALIAASSKESRVEIEALQVRKSAQAQLGEEVAMAAILAPVLRLLGGRKLYGVILAGLTARYLGGRR